MEDITDPDYMHAKWLCKDFEIKKIGEYHDLYVQGDTLLLADVFNNMLFKYMGLILLIFISLGLVWQAAL